MSVDISIVIVNYNTGELLLKCLKSIKDHISVCYEVIVADNASVDDSISICKEFMNDGRFHFITLKENVGFAKANNLAAQKCTGKMFHFLNPDTEVTAGLDDEYVYALSHPDAVYVNPLINRDGSFENANKVIPTLRNIFLWDFCRRKAQYWCIGASLIISYSNFQVVGKWCEDYFMYSEDLEIFYQIWSHHIPIEHLKVPIYHYKGGSSSSTWSNLDREINVQKSFRKFYGKYFSKSQYIAVKLYFVIHDILRHPSRVPNQVRAWIAVSKERY